MYQGHANFTIKGMAASGINCIMLIYLRSTADLKNESCFYDLYLLGNSDCFSL